MLHAKLSPSGASKWINCPPSANLESDFKDTSSSYADEGTLAHRLSEILIMHKLKTLDVLAFDRIMSDEIKTSPFYSGEMLEFCEEYADFVMEIFNEAKAHTKDAVIIQESKVDLTEWVPEGFGNLDVSIIADDTLYIIDLKYGKGVPVDANYNKQLLIYALGALSAYEDVYDFTEVKMFIHQPRINNSSNFTAPVYSLKQWAEEILKPAALKAWNGEGEYFAGDHCKFCKAKPVCKAHAEMQLQLAAYDFKQSPLLSDTEITDILDRTAAFKTWLGEVDAYALAKAIEGKKWPGYKLVEGRSNRKISDEETALKKLLAAGFEHDKVQITELRTITDLEKLTGKKQFGELLNDLIIKPPGKPTLAPESDKRPPLNSAEAAAIDFKNY